MTQDICTSTTSVSSTCTKPKQPRTKRSRSPKTIPFIWQHDPYNTAKGQMALWTAVITQALMDALSRSHNREAQFYKHEATVWLTENSKDFVEVCHNAGLNPDDVRKKAKRVIANPTLWRAEAGTGKRYQERKRYRLKCKERKEMAKPDIQVPPAHTAAQVIAGPWG